MPNKNIPAPLLQLMAEIGFLAISHNWFHKAHDIFQGLVCLAPQEEAAYIGLSFALCGLGHHQQAASLLSRTRISFLENAPQGKLPHSTQQAFVHCLLLFEALVWRIAGDYARLDFILQQQESFGEMEHLATALRAESMKISKSKRAASKKNMIM